ncbi:uncharacterized protein SPPG_05181 [Spizellomyces punctatus DAOM BR117]|uniref:SH3 domain-containing protein n=1 Tax=Spizellomyces punctatus (strain DAOM BR117) TaxID=645134 RepID=A0A0L0HG67_SPIPD|nr:uncharacterized protein SPPG_05181 [Spizellomyces punctatus DAOM BR117]KNC99803.1 hypothetical protein SPPG_05181 [Spizellomyces punctatus DAOM BR117]|eukprot:XP_016607843.1 hypothetical protein SPPG_05181 [Spizellomyces punctatus DAOM BR117]
MLDILVAGTLALEFLSVHSYAAVNLALPRANYAMIAARDKLLFVGGTPIWSTTMPDGKALQTQKNDIQRKFTIIPFNNISAGYDTPVPWLHNAGGFPDGLSCNLNHDSVHCFGGWSSAFSGLTTNSLIVFDAATLEQRANTSISAISPRAQHGAVILGGKLFVFAGTDSPEGRTAFDDLWTIDLQTYTASQVTLADNSPHQSSVSSPSPTPELIPPPQEVPPPRQPPPSTGPSGPPMRQPPTTTQPTEQSGPPMRQPPSITQATTPLPPVLPPPFTSMIISPNPGSSSTQPAVTSTVSPTTVTSLAPTSTTTFAVSTRSAAPAAPETSVSRPPMTFSSALPNILPTTAVIVPTSTFAPPPVSPRPATSNDAPIPVVTRSIAPPPVSPRPATSNDAPIPVVTRSIAPPPVSPRPATSNDAPIPVVTRSIAPPAPTASEPSRSPDTNTSPESNPPASNNPARPGNRPESSNSPAPNNGPGSNNAPTPNNGPGSNSSPPGNPEPNAQPPSDSAPPPTQGNRQVTSRSRRSNKSQRGLLRRATSQPVKPSARQSFCLSALTSNSFLLFGGVAPSGALLGDTWIFDADSSTWTNISTTHAPSPRMASACTTAPDSKIYLFGGYALKVDNNTQGQTFGPIGDLWMFSGKDWSLLAVEKTNSTTAGTNTHQPSARYFSAVIFPESSNFLFVYGGLGKDSVIATDDQLYTFDTRQIGFADPGGTSPPGVGWVDPPPNIVIQKEDQQNVALLVGCVVGGAAALALCVMGITSCILIRKKKNQKKMLKRHEHTRMALDQGSPSIERSHSWISSDHSTPNPTLSREERPHVLDVDLARTYRGATDVLPPPAYSDVIDPVSTSTERATPPRHLSIPSPSSISASPASGSTSSLTQSRSVLSGFSIPSTASSDSSPGDLMISHENYIPRLSDEMKLSAGDFICVRKIYEDGWAEGQNITTGDEGFFPHQCLDKTKGYHSSSTLLDKDAGAFDEKI